MKDLHDDSFVVKGLNGAKKLHGEIKISGSKNAVLPAIVASLLFRDKVIYTNVPKIDDVPRMLDILESVGSTAILKHGRITIDTNRVKKSELDEKIAKRLRASVIFSGPLLARTGRVEFPHPGGCVIGERPIDMFLDGFKKMGARVSHVKDKYIVSVSNKKLNGADIFFRVKSVTGTETFLMAGILAEGKTVIKNAATEPEVVHLSSFLKKCGAQIDGVGTETITVKGGGLLKSSGEIYKTPPDRIETGSYLILGALCAKSLKIKNCNPDELEVLTILLKNSGVPMKVGKSTIEIYRNTKSNKLFKTFPIKTHEYPGFPTDLQAPTVVYMTQATGESHVFETIFDGRLHYAQDLTRMGADITIWNDHEALVRGPKKLKRRELIGPDLRAGLAFIIAASVARGTSVIKGIHYIDRGYSNIEKKLQSIGLDIKRVKA